VNRQIGIRQIGIRQIAPHDSLLPAIIERGEQKTGTNDSLLPIFMGRRCPGGADEGSSVGDVASNAASTVDSTAGMLV
jgi:hypothetical protein